MKFIRRVFSATTAAVVGLSGLVTISLTGVAGAAGLNCVWTGTTNNNFNIAGNWSSCSGGVPGADDNLVFDVTSLSAKKTLTNDISNLSVANITFQGTNSNYYSYTIEGNAITITTGISNNAQTDGTTFSNPLTLMGAVSLTGTGYGTTFSGALGGNATVTKTGTSSVSFNADGSLSGSFAANEGSVSVGSASALGSAAVTIGNGADISLNTCTNSGFTFANDLTLQGASSYVSSDYSRPKLNDSAHCSGGGGGGVDESYYQYDATDATFTLSGTVTLGSDVTFGGQVKTTEITGPIAGSGKFILLPQYSGSLVINSSSNNSGTANGKYVSDPVVVTLTDSQPTRTLLVGNRAIVTLDGARGDTQVSQGGTLKGSGTVAALNVDGTVAPGRSPGCITSGDLSMSGTYQAEIGGDDACSGYDQLKVNGTVTLNNATLSTSLYDGFLPKQGATYTIIANDGTDAITGTFANLAEGATFEVSDGVFRISYLGGDGNDVVLTVVTAPTAPDTGFAILANNPLLTLGVTTFAALSLLVIARKMRKPAFRTRR